MKHCGPDDEKRGSDAPLTLVARISRLLVDCRGADTTVIGEAWRLVADGIGASVFLCSLADSQGQLRLAVSGGLTEDERANLTESSSGDAPWFGRAAARRESLIVEEVPDRGYDVLRAGGYSAYAEYPIVAGARLLGAIAFVTRGKTHFREDDLQVVGVIRDQVAALLHRAKVEEELRSSNERLTEVLAVKAVGVMFWDLSTETLVDSNDTFLEMMGYTRADIEAGALSWQKLTPAEYHPLSQAEMSKFAATGRVGPYEKEYLRKDGTRRWLLFSGSALSGNQCVEFCVDIHARKEAEAALHAAGESFRQLVQQSPFGIYAVDADFRLAIVSNGAQKIFSGVRPLHGRDFEEVLRILWPEPFVGDALAQFRKTLATGQPYHSPRTVEQRADIGETEAYDWKLERVVLPDGRPGVVCHFYDLSERQLVEAQLRDADQKKNEFLATLAHELRNPLAPIRTALAILKARNPDGGMEKYHGVMERQVERMTRLIDDLMDVARITHGQLLLQKTKIALSDAIQDAIDTCQPLLKARRHELSVKLPTEPLYVEGDLTRLSQVLANLLHNAAKYTDPGGHIALTVERRAAEVLVRVADDGIGISAANLSRVFEMFTQVHQGADRADGGLGIGLSLAQRLVEMHGGHVTAESAGSGHGSTFTVRLPIVLESQRGSDPVASRPRTSRSLRVLVVDDNLDAAELLSELLRLGGHDAHCAVDGSAALRICRTFCPEIVFCDLGMPGMDGLDVARRLRSDPAMRGVTLVALTGWGGEADRRKTAEAGFDRHLVKPVDPAAVDEILSAKAHELPPEQPGGSMIEPRAVDGGRSSDQRELASS